MRRRSEALVVTSNLPMASTRTDLGRPEVLATFFREILATGESIVRRNADRLSSCLVLATEERA